MRARAVVVCCAVCAAAGFAAGLAAGDGARSAAPSPRGSGDVHGAAGEAGSRPAEADVRHPVVRARATAQATTAPAPRPPSEDSGRIESAPVVTASTPAALPAADVWKTWRAGLLAGKAPDVTPLVARLEATSGREELLRFLDDETNPTAVNAVLEALARASADRIPAPAWVGDAHLVEGLWRRFDAPGDSARKQALLTPFILEPRLRIAALERRIEIACSHAVPDVRARAIASLYHDQDLPRVSTVLIDLATSDPEDRCRAAALRASREIASADAREARLGGLRSASADVRAAAVASIRAGEVESGEWRAFLRDELSRTASYEYRYSLIDRLLDEGASLALEAVENVRSAAAGDARQIEYYDALAAAIRGGATRKWEIYRIVNKQALAFRHGTPR